MAAGVASLEEEHRHHPDGEGRHADKAQGQGIAGLIDIVIRHQLDQFVVVGKTRAHAGRLLVPGAGRPHVQVNGAAVIIARTAETERLDRFPDPFGGHPRQDDIGGHAVLVQAGLGGQAPAGADVAVVCRTAVARGEGQTGAGLQAVLQKVEKCDQPQRNRRSSGLVGGVEDPVDGLQGGRVVAPGSAPVGAMEDAAVFFTDQMDAAVAAVEKTLPFSGAWRR